MRLLVLCSLSAAALAFDENAASYKVDDLNVKTALQLLRVRRKNDGMFEELRDDDYERECVQEQCSKEELTEIYPNDKKKVDKKWREFTRMCYEDKCSAQGTDKCIQEWSKRTCICKDGFEGSACEKNKNECENENICGKCKKGLTKKTCKDTIGSYKCICKSGYKEQPDGCADIDECTDGTANCKKGEQCNNLAGSFTCDCKKGYARTKGGDTCTDIDECEGGNIDCGTGKCSNTKGGFECKCDAGHKLVDGGGGHQICENGCPKTHILVKGKCIPKAQQAPEKPEPVAKTTTVASEDVAVKASTVAPKVVVPPVAVTKPKSAATTAAPAKPIEGGNPRKPGVPGGSNGGRNPVDPTEAPAAVKTTPASKDQRGGVGPSDPKEGKPESSKPGKGNKSPSDKPKAGTTPVNKAPTSPKTGCAKGFRWVGDADTGTCTDIDECFENREICPVMCMNYYGGYQCYDDLRVESKMCHHSHVTNTSESGYACTCFNGYHLCYDLFSCIADDDYDEYDHNGKFKYNAPGKNDCKSGQVGVNKKCYSVHEDKKTYTQANDLCKSKGAKLAMVEDRKVWWVLGNNVGNGLVPFWVNRASVIDLQIFGDPKGDNLLANLASNMNSVPPQLNVVKDNDEHAVVCEHESDSDFYYGA